MTFTTPPGERVTTRVGEHEVTTEGPFHDRAGLRPRVRHRVRARGRGCRTRRTGGCRRRSARSSSRAGRLLADPRHRQRRALRRDRVRHAPATRHRCDRPGAAQRARRPAVSRAHERRGRRRDARARSRRRGGQGRPDRHRQAPRSTRRSSRATAGSARACTTCAATTTPCATPSWRVEGAPVRDRARRSDARGARHRRPGQDRRRARRRAASAGSTTSQRATADPVLVFGAPPRVSNHDPNVRPAPPTTTRRCSTCSPRRENIVGYLAGHTHRNRVVRDSSRRATSRASRSRAPRTTPAPGASTASTKVATPR